MTKLSTVKFQNKRLSSPALKRMSVLNIAIGIIKVRDTKEAIERSVTITKDKKTLNQKRKIIKNTEDTLDELTAQISNILDLLSLDELEKVRARYSSGVIKIIPEDKTNLHLLGLNMLYLEFQDCIDKKMDSIFTPYLKYDYMDIIVTISEEIGLEKDVAEDMYLLAMKMNNAIKGLK